MENLEGLEEGPVMEDDIKDLENFNDPISDVEILDDLSLDDVAVDELSEIPLDNPEVEIDKDDKVLSDDFDAVQDVAVEESQQEDLAKDLEAIEDINEDPEVIEEDVELSEDSSDEIDIDPDMSIDDLDEDEDEISSDATEVSLDDEAGFEENLQILSKKSPSYSRHRR